MEIRCAGEKELIVLTGLAKELWGGHPTEELAGELEALIKRKDCLFLIAWMGVHPMGFAQCQLRRDYVEGTHSSPVGYLEGVYVRQEYRGQGCARALVGQCERWAQEHGCEEFASDCELGNEASRGFHLKTGFSEANRIICFTKRLRVDG